MEYSRVQDFQIHPNQPAQFAGYQILEHLGKGGMGDVYKALQIGLDRTVALKILPSLLARNPQFSERFFSEAYAISRLQHQNIVTIYDYGEENYQKYIAMQYVQGPTLSQLLKQNGPLNWPRIIHITKQIGRGLKYAHQSDIVHRDIKSGNIMVEAGDRVYISDFGIAKVIDAPNITTTGMTMGTPEYMAPEQCQGGIVDGQSDIYGLGIILFELVTGKPPFLADTSLAVAFKQVHEAPPLLSQIRRDIPPRLELIVAKCLKKDKADRYKNADELLHDLDSVDKPSPIQVDVPAAPSNQRITDRREMPRRRGLTPQIRRRVEFLQPVLIVILFLGLAYAWIRPTANPGLHLASPVAAEGKIFSDGVGEYPPQLAVDGDPTTAWVTLPLNVTADAELRLPVPPGHLLMGITLEVGPAGESTGILLGAPSRVIVGLRGEEPRPFDLLATSAPQYLPLSGSTSGDVSLRFEAPENSPPLAVRELRLALLPL